MSKQQFNRQRFFVNKATGQKSDRIIDILPPKLTVDPVYLIQDHETRYTTLFREVDVLKSHDVLTDAQYKLIKMNPSTSTLDENGSKDAILAAIKKSIADNWHPDKFHLVHHSSGLDSRMISWSIKQLYQESGDEWLGSGLLFACFGPEWEAFENIMRYEGWPTEKYFSIPNNDGSYYQRNCGNFKEAGRWINGATRGPHSLNYTLTEILQERGLVPNDDDNIQIINGYGSDYEFRGGNDVKGNMLGIWFEKGYRAITSTSFFKVRDIVYPFLNHGVIKEMIKSRYRLGYNIRKPLLEHLDEGLAEMPRISRQIKDPLPAELFNRCVTSYENSWYGQNVKPRVVPNNSFYTGDWWAAWSQAAFCEWLLERGYQLEVDNDKK